MENLKREGVGEGAFWAGVLGEPAGLEAGGLKVDLGILATLERAN